MTAFSKRLFHQTFGLHQPGFETTSIDSKNIYKSKLVPVPRPECFVLYNGAAEYPDETTLKLSDTFARFPAFGLAGEPDLELKVKVININKGHNKDRVRRCEKLNGYSVFISKAREFEGALKDREAAVKAAVKYCISHGVLKDFLGVCCASHLKLVTIQSPSQLCINILDWSIFYIYM